MNLRVIAVAVLVKVIKDGQSLTVALDQAFQTIPESKDRAFIQALCFGVIRYYSRLDFILKQLLSKPLRNKDTDVKIVLIIGLYQLQYMRVKPHAAVSETVSAVKKKSWAKALINGVLRQYIREQAALEQQADNDLLASCLHPEWLINKITADWGEQADSILNANNQQAPMVLRVNQLKTSRDNYLQLLSHAKMTAQAVSVCKTAIILEHAVAVEKLPQFQAGWVSVQDTAAQLSAELLDVQAGQSVLDLCAAPGGKTAANLESQTGDIDLVAVDIDETRLVRVKENLKRLELTAKVLIGDASKPEQWAKGQLFDRILVDAPCSALGVIRRHPDIKVLRRESDMDALQAVQHAILKSAWLLLKPNGLLLYATCSVLKQENEQQMVHFLANHSDAEELVIESEWGVKQIIGRQILTGDNQMDGFYYAKLRKKRV